jgi:carboxyl-terminal processing protease
MSTHKKTKQYVVLSIALALALFLGGFFLGSSRPSTAGASVVNTKADFTEFWKVWTMIDEKFPDASTISVEDRITGATKGLVESLGDKYSVFFDPEETKSFQESITGSFGGVGIEIDEQDGILVVIAPIKGTPAYTAGVQTGDYIIKIDGKTTEGLSIDEAIKQIRGEEGTPVVLTLLAKEGKTARDIKIIRAIAERCVRCVAV